MPFSYVVDRYSTNHPFGIAALTWQHGVGLYHVIAHPRASARLSVLYSVMAVATLSIVSGPSVLLRLGC